MTTLQRRSAEPIRLEGGPVACLLIHGFAGSPAEIRPLAQHLARQGYTVVAPVLPGHGTRPEELRQTRWPQWVRAAEAELATLQQRHAIVHVIGFSMGGLIALYLAAHHPVASVTSLAAPIKLADWRQVLIPLARYIMPYYPTRISNPEIAAQLDNPYDRLPVDAIQSMRRLARQVRKDLPRITAPTLAVQGERDRWIAPESAAHIAGAVSSQAVRLEMLPGRNHFVTLERGREELFGTIDKWVDSHSH